MIATIVNRHVESGLYCRDAESATTQESLFDLSELEAGNEKQN